MDPLELYDPDSEHEAEVMHSPPAPGYTHCRGDTVAIIIDSEAVELTPDQARRLRDWLTEWLDLYDTHPAALDAATVAD